MRALVLLGLLVGACDRRPPSSRGHETAEPPPTPARPPACRVEPEGVPVASWPGPGECPTVLLARSGGSLHLEGLGDAPLREADGAAPPCRVAACRYEGFETALGSMIIASEPSAESEVPQSVWLGIIVGSALVFFDLWAGAGPEVIEDSTAVGPAHALVPMRCGAELGLFAKERLPGAERLEISPGLRAREGRIALRGGATLTPGTSDGCQPIDIPLP